MSSCWSNSLNSSSSHCRLRKTPNLSHEPENYENLQTKFNPFLYSSFERHLPPQMLNASRDAKAQHIDQILMDYAPDKIAKLNKEYRERIISTYQPMHSELYRMNPTSFFVPSFLNAISENTEEGFPNIISEPSPGILTFEMLQPEFCKMLLDEVENFENWCRETRTSIMRPNTMNAYGVVLDEFGLETMLDKMMKDFILPMSTIFFPEVGGATLDSHHGYIVEYGTNRDDHLGLHMDDSEVTLNVCLGEQFSGGELFFCGVRCDKHKDVESDRGEIYNYSHIPGRAVLHRGRHRHAALSTTSGNRVNMLLWCRSFVFREMRKYEKRAPSWCDVCQKEKKEKLHSLVAALKLEVENLIAGGPTHSHADSNSLCCSQADSWTSNSRCSSQADSSSP